MRRRAAPPILLGAGLLAGTPRAYTQVVAVRQERPVVPMFWFALLRHFPTVRTLTSRNGGNIRAMEDEFRDRQKRRFVNNLPASDQEVGPWRKPGLPEGEAVLTPHGRARRAGD